MTKISIYNIDEYVTADDKWIGTDVNTYNKTKNFTPRKLASYFNGSQVINTGVDLLYKYFTITPPEIRPAGTLSFEIEIGATVNFSSINTFLLSKTTLKGNDVSEFLDFLVGSNSLIYKAKNINLFGNYKILSIEPYFIDPNFFVVNVDFIEGNGFIEEDEEYMISIVDLERTILIPQLVKETFDYNSSNSFTLSNEINNVLQVIVNTTSLHPEAYSYTLPSTVTVLNELYAGDIITIVYNYLEDFLEVPDLQRVTNIGNHTTNNIVIDNIPGEYGDYTVINTLNDQGTFQSYTSPTSVDYQSVYAAYEMSINEIYSPTESLEMFVGQGIINTSYSNGSNTTSARILSGDSVNGASIYIEKNDINGQLKADNLTDNITLQFPDKPEGTYTIATTEDVPPFIPSDYDLDEFTNTNIDPFAKISDIPVLGYTPVNRAGDTMSGLLVLSGDPGAALGAATKQYVDNISGNINFHSPVYTATTGNLIANYDNGVAGVGATLIATTNGALQVDGEFPSYLDRVLVWQQNDAFQNGVYKVDVVGDSVTPYTLIRSTDSDNNPAGEIRYGDYTLILSGDTNGGKGFICNTVGTVVVGTTPITFVQYNVAQAVTPGYGLLTSSPNVIAINTAITQEKITLTTDGSGAATLIGNTLNIPEAGGGTVTSITATAPLTGGTITSTGNIGISQATISSDGYLTSTDWSTFANKADEDSPTFTGTPLAPTAAAGTNNTQIATTEFVKTTVNNRVVVETTAGWPLTNADSGKIIIFMTTTSQTLNIPLGLDPGFECTFVTLANVILSVVANGNILNNAAGTTMTGGLSFTLKRMLAPNTYISTGNL